MIDHLDDADGRRGGLHQDRGAGQICLLCRHRHRRLTAMCSTTSPPGQPVDPRLARRGGARLATGTIPPAFSTARRGSITESSRYIRDWQVCAIVTGLRRRRATRRCSLRNKFTAGDTLELVGPDLAAFSFQAPEMTDADGAPLLQPRHPQMVFQIQLPRPVPPRSMLRRQVDLSAK